MLDLREYKAGGLQGGATAIHARMPYSQRLDKDMHEDESFRGAGLCQQRLCVNMARADRTCQWGAFASNSEKAPPPIHSKEVDLQSPRTLWGPPRVMRMLILLFW